MNEAGMTASQMIDNRIVELADWRGKMLERLRKLINEASPGIEEEWKWDTAVWTQNGLVCSVGAFKDHMKIHFFKGSSLTDPNGLFNAGLDAKTMRAVDIHEGDAINETALKELVREAAAYNKAGGKKK